ncbi:MAG: radical SAM protein [Acidobacteria bacterium]|nr:radical SAM protein [Acidobacteriota bacterium]
MALRPSYIALHARGELTERARAARAQLADCALCPRRCHVDRMRGAGGHCGVGRQALVSSYHPHHGEESPLSGQRGSGTIFFASCSLGCLFCQNWTTSHLREGTAVSDQRLGDMMLELQALGCHNINLVTPTHVVAQVLGAVVHAAERGLTLPIVYNTGGYDLASTLALLDGVVDIFMPDVKTLDEGVSAILLKAEEYPEAVRSAVREMHRQVGDLVLSDTGVAMRGLLVRHLVMPGDLAATREVMRFLARDISPATYVNLMDQYWPCGAAPHLPTVNRPITAREFDEALAACRAEGIRRLDGGAGARFRRPRSS